MKAILTSDLFKEGSEKLVVKTCASMFSHMSQIYDFMDNMGFLFKISGNHESATLTIYGENLMPNITKIMNFVHQNGWVEKASSDTHYDEEY